MFEHESLSRFLCKPETEKIYAKEVSYIQNFQNVAVILHVNLETIIIFQNIYIYSTLYKEMKFREQE